MPRATLPRNLVDRLDAMSRTTTWIVLAGACVAFVLLDRAVPEVGTGPLYIPLIALAGWRLGTPEACVVALAAAVLNILPIHGVDPNMSPFMAAVRGMMRLGAYAFVTATVCGLRRVYDRERFAVRHDALTGALNRAVFEAHARPALEASKADGSVAVLALVDLDGFKAVNDTAGHALGDDLLRSFAMGGAEAVGDGGRFGRLGGDEFVLLLRARTVADAQLRIEATHRRLRDGLKMSGHPVGVSLERVMNL